MNRLGIAGVLLLTSCVCSFAGIDWQAKKSDEWLGHTRHYFDIEGVECWVVEPKSPKPGNPWIWCTEWPTAFTDRTGTPMFLADGYYFLYAKVGYMCLGGDVSLQKMDAFYRFFTAKGLRNKGVFTGVSRGGLYAFRFAWQHPERVTCLYGDHAVLDFKSWPLHIGDRKYNPKDTGSLQAVKQMYGLQTMEEILSYPHNPIDILPKIAEAKIPIVLVIGDADIEVPPEFNSNIVEYRYRKLGGEVKTFRYPKYQHHPHGVDNPRELVDLIESWDQR